MVIGQIRSHSIIHCSMLNSVVITRAVKLLQLKHRTDNALDFHVGSGGKPGIVWSPKIGHTAPEQCCNNTNLPEKLTSHVTRLSPLNESDVRLTPHVV